MSGKAKDSDNEAQKSFDKALESIINGTRAGEVEPLGPRRDIGPRTTEVDPLGPRRDIGPRTTEVDPLGPRRDIGPR